MGVRDGYYISSVRLVLMIGSHEGCPDPGRSVGYYLPVHQISDTKYKTMIS